MRGQHAVILAGISTAEESNGYRAGNYLGQNKLSTVPICGAPLVTRLAETYLSPGTGISTLRIIGEVDGLEQHIPQSYRSRVWLDKEEGTLGTKLHLLEEYGDDMIYLATNDLLPSRHDLCEFVRLARSNGEASAVAAAIRGDPLVRSGFRQHDSHKLYRIKHGGDVVSVAYPQMYAIRPGHLRIEGIAGLADTYFSERENGGNTCLLTPQALGHLAGYALGIPKLIDVWHRLRPRGEASLAHWSPTLDDVSRTLTPVVKWSKRARDPPVCVGMLDAPTLAMDIDDAHEREIRERLFREERGLPQE